MERRRLGRSGPEVSALGLGCYPLTGAYGDASEREALRTVARALDLGINLLDTGDVYGGGRNEQLVGRAIRGRDDVLVATKFGLVPQSGARAHAIDGSAAYVRRACEASLSRLGVETIDLYQQHRVDPATPIEETIGAMAELVSEGKVRYIGLSEATSAEIRRAAAVHPIASVQSEYSLLEREVEDDVLDTCGELGIGFVAFSPLMRGLLGGNLTTPPSGADMRKSTVIPRLAAEHLGANNQLAQTVGDVAAAHGVTMAEVALAWVISRRAWIVAIPGTRRTTHLDSNARALSLNLTDADERRLEPLASAVSGDRYGPAAVRPDAESRVTIDA